MKLLHRSVSLATELFQPAIFQKSYHFSFGFVRNRLLAIGQNKPEKPNAKAFRFAQRFNVQHLKRFPFLHSETDLLGRLWGVHHIDGDLTVVNVRLSKHGELVKAKPCKNCQTIFDALGITRVFWSDNGAFRSAKDNNETLLR